MTGEKRNLNLNLEAHKAVMQNQHETRCYTHVNGNAIVSYRIPQGALFKIHYKAP
jgi:hypothetical protein